MSVCARIALAVILFSGRLSADEITDLWTWTLQPPAQAWTQPDFDDTNWKSGFGGFGTPGTPGSRIGTEWSSDAIWLRKRFQLDTVPQQPALLIHHDEDADVYLNGQQIASFDGFLSKYEIVPLTKEAAGRLSTGEQLLAVHCRQTNGGQFIDVHLVDAASVPKLPRPRRSLIPFQTTLTTTWGEAVTAENAWTEYPRPRLVRDRWTNLNGHWDYAISAGDQRESPDEWAGKILVPFAPESQLSGVERMLDTDQALWYRRSFQAATKNGQRQLIHFEAVDYSCEVFVNGQLVGTHTGGHTPFTFDITDEIHDGENRLTVRVTDATEEYQLRGKQSLRPRGIWYTQVSGIWQTVWLEEVPSTYLKDVVISTDAATGTIRVSPISSGRHAARVQVFDDGEPVASATGIGTLTLAIPDAKLWSPSTPHLYDVVISLLDETGAAADTVRSYAGIRTIARQRGTDGHWRMTLNGQPLFHWGPLDQGWWPDGLLTPPSDEAMRFDIEWLKSAGFNMIRKHIKVEPRRYYYHCDRLGMLVWQDQVSGGPGPEWTRLFPLPNDAEWPEREHQQYMLELDRMITALESHPCIAVWVPFNEAWGQHRTMQVGDWIRQRDPSRLINIASGGNFFQSGNIVDEHRYPHPGFPFELAKGGRFHEFIKVIGEFGGHGLPVQGHLYDAGRRNWGYGDLPRDATEYRDRYVKSIRMLNELRGQGIAAGVYTQTTDVEGEINGLMTYDRRVIKIPAEELAELHRILFTTP